MVYSTQNGVLRCAVVYCTWSGKLNPPEKVRKKVYSSVLYLEWKVGTPRNFFGLGLRLVSSKNLGTNRCPKFLV